MEGEGVEREEVGRQWKVRERRASDRDEENRNEIHINMDKEFRMKIYGLTLKAALGDSGRQRRFSELRDK